MALEFTRPLGHSGSAIPLSFSVSVSILFLTNVIEIYIRIRMIFLVNSSDLQIPVNSRSMLASHPLWKILDPPLLNASECVTTNYVWHQMMFELQIFTAATSFILNLTANIYTNNQSSFTCNLRDLTVCLWKASLILNMCLRRKTSFSLGFNSFFL